MVFGAGGAYGLFMVRLWFSGGVFMICLRFVYGFLGPFMVCLVCLWFVYGFFGGRSWFVYGVFMVFLERERVSLRNIERERESEGDRERERVSERERERKERKIERERETETETERDKKRRRQKQNKETTAKTTKQHPCGQRQRQRYKKLTKPTQIPKKMTHPA